MHYRLHVNGKSHSVDVDSDTSVCTENSNPHIALGLPPMSAFGGKADITIALRNDRWSEGKRGTTQFGFGARDSAILVSAMS